VVRLENAGLLKLPCRIGKINRHNCADRTGKTGFRLERLGRRYDIGIVGGVGHGVAGTTLMSHDSERTRGMCTDQQLDLGDRRVPLRTTLRQHQAIGTGHRYEIDTLDFKQFGQPAVQIDFSLVQAPIRAGQCDSQFSVLTPPHTPYPQPVRFARGCSTLEQFIDEAEPSYNGTNAQNDSCMKSEHWDSKNDAGPRNLTQPC
jgi:hypothetical protein